MKRFLVELVLFMLCASVVYTVSIASIRSNVSPEYFPTLTKRSNSLFAERLHEASTYGPVDIVVVGSSHAYRGFDPRIFSEHGYSMFNLGSSIQSPIQSEMLLHQYIDELQPKYVIYEVFPETFAVDGVESALDYLAGGCVDVPAALMVARVRHPMVLNAFIHKAYREYDTGECYTGNPVVHGADTYITGGFVETNRTAFTESPQVNTPVTINARRSQFSAFERTLAFLAEQDIEVLLVQAPVTEPYYRRVLNRAEFNEYFALHGVPYYNFNEGYTWETSLFYDSHHLTQAGVELFNPELIPLLEN